jgi:hypothetical protein
MVDLWLGTGCLITGVEDHPEGWTQVYVGPRWLRIYVVVTDMVERDRVKRAWGSSMHLTMPVPHPSALYDDDRPYIHGADDEPD